MDSFTFAIASLLCVFGFSSQEAAGLTLTMTPEHYHHINRDKTPTYNVMCVLRDSAGQPVPLTGCQYRSYYEEYTWQFNVGLASPNYTHSGHTGKYQGRGLEHGECGLTFGGYRNHFIFILGCRVKPVTGGWQTAVMMLYVDTWATMQYHLKPPGVTLALAGSDVTLTGKAEHVLNQCRFDLPPADNTDYLNFDSGPDSDNHSLARYHGEGLDRKECGITLLNVQPERSGFVRGDVYSSSPDGLSSDFIELIVMSAPESPPLLTVLTPGVLQPGDILEATCLVANSRPAANITWHVGDVQVTSGITEDGDLDSTWRWNHDPQTVQTRLRLRVDSSHYGKKLLCRAGHLALPSGFQNSTSVNIRVIGDTNCGTWKPNVQLVTGGQDATRGQFPWHAALYGRLNNGSFVYFCGGTLIKPNVVVTAAHCVYSERSSTITNASQLRVALGKLDRDYKGDPANSGVQTSDVTSIVVYRQYQGSRTNTQFDLALLKLSSPVQKTPTVGVACMEWAVPLDEDVEELMTGVIGRVSGWGVNNDYTTGSRTLQWIDLPWIDRQSCINQTMFRAQHLITHDKFCAGFVNKTKSVCEGDSGGGYMVLKNGRFYLKGVVSTALSYTQDKNVCSAEHYTTFTSLSRYTSWLKRNVERMS